MRTPGKRLNKKKVFGVGAALFFTICWSINSCVGPRSAFSIQNHLVEYDSLISNIEHEQDSMVHWYRQATNTTARTRKIKEARTHLLETLTTEVFPYWYYTRWDFNGTTETPRQGNIACGYFVTTTLKHAGFKVERVRLAQQPASNIIKTLCKPGTLKRIGHNRTQELINHLKAQENGLYILGLDSHVGFVQKQGDYLYFIHSSYSNGRQVMKEQLGESNVVLRSDNYYIANLLANDELIRSWLTNRHIHTQE